MNNLWNAHMRMAVLRNILPIGLSCAFRPGSTMHAKIIVVGIGMITIATNKVGTLSDRQQLHINNNKIASDAPANRSNHHPRKFG